MQWAARSEREGATDRTGLHRLSLPKAENWPSLERFLRHSSSLFGKTRAAKRDIPLSNEARTLRAERLEKLGTEVYAFPSKRDSRRPMGQIANTHHRTVKRTGLAPFRLYDLRHTFATRVVQSGMDLPTLAGILGHSKLNMVLRYAHPTPEHKRRAITRLEQYITEARLQSHDATPTQSAWLN